MLSERSGKSFGIKCWEQGLSVEETLKKAALECGLEALPSDPTKWPKFIHGAEESWQDCNLSKLDEQDSLNKLIEKHVNKL